MSFKFYRCQKNIPSGSKSHEMKLPLPKILFKKIQYILSKKDRNFGCWHITISWKSKQVLGKKSWFLMQNFFPAEVNSQNWSTRVTQATAWNKLSAAAQHRPGYILCHAESSWKIAGNPRCSHTRSSIRWRTTCLAQHGARPENAPWKICDTKILRFFETLHNCKLSTCELKAKQSKQDFTPTKLLVGRIFFTS